MSRCFKMEFRVSREERRKIRARAHNEGMSESDFLRSMALAECGLDDVVEYRVRMRIRRIFQEELSRQNRASS